MGVKKASRHRRIAGIRRILEEITADDISTPPPPLPAVPRPEWLPEDWTMEVRRRKDPEKYDRYYICPATGKMFRSKPEVLRHLYPSTEKVENFLVPFCEGYTLGPSGGSKHLLAALEDYPVEWLPTGWILEFGTWMNGVSEANDYKCYFDPLAGSRFYSKHAVLHYLEAHKHQGSSDNANLADFCSPTQEENNMNYPHNVLAQIDYSPAGLPHGWIKEIKFTRTKTTQKIRRDSFYIDTVSGYAFRSSKDALRYLENKEICRLAFRLEESHLPKAHSSMKEYLPSTAVRQLKLKETAPRGHRVSRKTPKRNVRTMTVISEPPQSSSSAPAYLASAESGDNISKPGCSTLAIFQQTRGYDNGKFGTESQAMAAFDTEGFPGHPTNKKEPEAANNDSPVMQLEENYLQDLDLSLQQFKMIKKTYQRKKHSRKRSPASSNTKATAVTANQPGPSKRKAVNAITFPMRASKRLAGAEADPLLDIGIGERSLRVKATQPDEPQPTLDKDSDSSCGPHQKGASESELQIEQAFHVEHAAEEQKVIPSVEQQVEQATEAAQTTEEQNVDPPVELPSADAEPKAEHAMKEQKVDPPMELPYGNPWLEHPTYKFAVKTLAGNMPVLEDTAALQECYLRQLRSVHMLRPTSGSPPPSVSSDGAS